MEVILSINNREKVIHLPVLPSEFTIQSPEQNETYQTIGLGEVNLIGNKGLKSLSFSSFFPEKAIAYSKNTDIFGWDFVNEIETLRNRKLPFRFIITETPINMPVTIENFEYGLKAGSKDIQYSIELKEFRFM